MPDKEMPVAWERQDGTSQNLHILLSILDSPPPAKKSHALTFRKWLLRRGKPEDVKTFYKIYNEKTPPTEGLRYPGMSAEGGLELWRKAEVELEGTELAGSFAGLLCVSKGDALCVFHPFMVPPETLEQLRPVREPAGPRPIKYGTAILTVTRCSTTGCEYGRLKPVHTSKIQRHPWAFGKSPLPLSATVDVPYARRIGRAPRRLRALACEGGDVAGYKPDMTQGFSMAYGLCLGLRQRIQVFQVEKRGKKREKEREFVRLTCTQI
ncbi:hypothetical protein FB451DRAFT_1163640 [Mycena latifolia]|nr:hypothetical protein FB451DRAFT_1163640 [Mycena latifolia]